MPDPSLDPNYPIGIHEAARYTGLSLKTLRNLASHNELPPADFPAINDQPAWKWSTWQKWLIDTGRHDQIQRRAARVAASISL